MPASEPVPLEFGVNVTPTGREPLTLTVGVGLPCAVTMKLPGVPTVNAVEAGLEKVGAWRMVSVNDCVTVPPIPLVALNVSG